jgi:DNA polymerase-1
MKPTYDLPRIVEPLKNSELKKEGYFSTEESTLLSLKPNKSVKSLITWLLERVKIVKLKSTYLEGLPKTIKDHGWLPNMLHSTLNQCVATTGRLSSVRPNQQNLPKEAKKFCITRYKS